MRKTIVATTLAMMLATALISLTSGIADRVSASNANSLLLAQGRGTVSINDASLMEGDAATSNMVFIVTVTGSHTNTVGVNYSTANDGATSPSDFTSTSGQLVFPPGGDATMQIIVPIVGDTSPEPEETFSVNLSIVDFSGDLADGQGVGTIHDNDDAAAPPQLAINDVSVLERNTGALDAILTVTLSAASSSEVTVSYATADGTATLTDNDYSSRTNTLRFPVGATAMTIAIPVVGDSRIEQNETFVVNLSNPENATIADGQGECTITNDDDATSLPSLSINDVTVIEGNDTDANGAGTMAVFSISLSGASSSEVTVNYATADGTATVTDNDYVSQSGTVRFPPNDTTRKTISIAVVGDTKSFEPNETFLINLSSPIGATLGDAQGVGTIIEDNETFVFTLSISDPPLLTEGDSGTRNMVFTVTLTPVGVFDSHDETAVSYETENGPAPTGATAPSDYDGTSGRLVFPAGVGVATMTISVPVSGDTSAEPDETFFVTLSNPSASFFDEVVITNGQAVGTIRDDDSGCIFVLNTTRRSVPASPGSFSVGVEAKDECSWTAATATDWIIIHEPIGDSGNIVFGNGNLRWDTAVNNGPARTGTIIIAGQTFTVNQAARNPCSFSLSKNGVTFPAGGGNGSAEVSTLNGCEWRPTTSDAWVTISRPSSGSTGSDDLEYRVAPNNGPHRVGTINIAPGFDFSINQDAPEGCNYRIQPTSLSLEANSSTGTIMLSPGGSQCNWTALSHSSWITIASRQSGTGDVSITYSVEANTGPKRTGRLSIAGFAFQVFQNGARTCPPTLFPGREVFPARGGPSVIEVSALSDCDWRAGSNDPWIIITDSVQSDGRGTVRYFVRPNTSPNARGGTISIGGQGFFVSQRGVPSPCVQEISPRSNPIECCFKIGEIARLPTREVEVTAPPDCVWDAIPGADWFGVAAATSESGNQILKGNGRLIYEVGINDSQDSLSRSGLLDVGGKQHRILQEAPGGPCAIELFCNLFPAACPEGASSTLSESRDFRDQLLGKSARGKRYTELYYKFSTDAVGIMMLNPMLVLRSREIMERYMPVIHEMTKGGRVTLTQGDLEEIDGFLHSFAEKGSPELNEAIDGLCEDLRDPQVQKEFNFSVTDGPKRGLNKPNKSNGSKEISRLSLLLGLMFGGVLLAGVCIRKRSVLCCITIAAVLSLCGSATTLAAVTPPSSPTQATAGDSGQPAKRDGRGSRLTGSPKASLNSPNSVKGVGNAESPRHHRWPLKAYRPNRPAGEVLRAL